MGEIKQSIIEDRFNFLETTLSTLNTGSKKYKDIWTEFALIVASHPHSILKWEDIAPKDKYFNTERWMPLFVANDLIDIFVSKSLISEDQSILAFRVMRTFTRFNNVMEWSRLFGTAASLEKQGKGEYVVFNLWNNLRPHWFEFFNELIETARDYFVNDVKDPDIPLYLDRINILLKILFSQTDFEDVFNYYISYCTTNIISVFELGLKNHELPDQIVRLLKKCL